MPRAWGGHAAGMSRHEAGIIARSIVQCLSPMVDHTRPPLTRLLSSIALVLALAPLPAIAQSADLPTHAERTGYVETGRYDEVQQLCEAFAAKENALYTQTAWDKHMTFFSVYFRASRVELVYSRKWETMAPPSVLFARIYLSKNNPVYLHLPELIGFLGIDDYRACYFPYIVRYF